MNPLLILVSVILFLAALILLIPTAVLFVECVAALLPARRSRPRGEVVRPTIAILVPAHNEAWGIEATLQTLLPQLATGDRLVVIADNCEDETAAISRQAGATVIERQNLELRGKGYALDFGLQFLAANPPDVVAIVDADCLVSPGSIEKIAQLAIEQTRPVQATYLLTRPARPSPKDAVSVLAFTVKNLVRPFGLRQLGLPNLLTGTGMALPWSLIHTVSLASGQPSGRYAASAGSGAGWASPDVLRRGSGDWGTAAAGGGSQNPAHPLGAWTLANAPDPGSSADSGCAAPGPV